MRLGVRITPNPYQRAAAECLLLAAILSLAGAGVAAFPLLLVAFVFALVAVSKRGDHPRG
jgi:hypothetical protein